MSIVIDCYRLPSIIDFIDCSGPEKNVFVVDMEQGRNAKTKRNLSTEKQTDPSGLREIFSCARAVTVQFYP